MENSIYLVIAANHNNLDDFPVYGMYYYNNRFKAMNCAVLCTGVVCYLNETNEIYSDIYRIPFGENIAYGEDWVDLKYLYYNYRIKRVRPRMVIAAETIQRRFRVYLKKRIDAVVFLQCALRKAIANPYTQLCRKRLMREFNELIEYF
jgi:hypothetical protein